MIHDADEILEHVDRIAATINPDKVIVFGSYAYGRPSVDSDVDLLVVADYTGPTYRMEGKIRREIPASFPRDVLVRSADQIATLISQNDFFLEEVMRKGIVVHARDNKRLGEKGRRRLRQHLASRQVA